MIYNVPKDKYIFELYAVLVYMILPFFLCYFVTYPERKRIGTHIKNCNVLEKIVNLDIGKYLNTLTVSKLVHCVLKAFMNKNCIG